MLRVNTLSGFGAIRPVAGGGTITWHSATAPIYSASSGTSVAPDYPASIGAGDLLVVILGMKGTPTGPVTGSATTPDDWTLIDSKLGGGGYGGAPTADTGNTNVWAYYLVAAGTETGSLSITVADNNICWAVMHRLSKDTGTWSVVGTVGEDTSGDSSVSVTFEDDPGVQAGDYVISGFVIPTDVNAAANFTDGAFTQSGVTFGTVVEEAEPSSAVGFDVAGGHWHAPVTAGTSGGAPTFTATGGGTTTNLRGSGIFVRVRAA